MQSAHRLLRVMSIRLETHNGTDRARRVDKVERRAKEARQRVIERCPASVGFGVVVGFHPRPELDACSAAGAAVLDLGAPLLAVPAAEGEFEVELFGGADLEDLREGAGEDGVVVVEGAVAHEAERSETGRVQH